MIGQILYAVVTALIIIGLILVMRFLVDQGNRWAIKNLKEKPLTLEQWKKQIRDNPRRSYTHA